MNFERAYDTMLSEKQGARVIGLLLRTKEFTYQTQAIDMGEMNINKSHMVTLLRDIFLSIFDKNRIYRTTGVTFSELSLFTPKQLCVFDIDDRVQIKNKNISNALTKLKERFGENIVHQGFIRDSNVSRELPTIFEVG